MANFSVEEVLHIIGYKVEIDGKYEDGDPHGASILIDDNDSEEVLGEKLAHYANKVGDISNNHLIEEQRNRLFRLNQAKDGMWRIK